MCIARLHPEFPERTFVLRVAGWRRRPAIMSTTPLPPFGEDVAEFVDKIGGGSAAAFAD